MSCGDAVLRLLTERHGEPPPLPADRTSRRLGAACWIGSEQRLVPPRPAWPAKPNAVQILTPAGLAALVLTCALIPLSVAVKAAMVGDHPRLLALAVALIAATGSVAVYRLAPRLMALPGKTAALPGLAALLTAVLLWQGQSALSSYYFADPLQRFERQFTRPQGCLAASPYRHDNVASTLDDTALIIIPLTGETSLRLGPAANGSTHPLRPLDRPTRAVLSRYGC